MSWYKVDDKLTAHRKFLRLGRIYGTEVRCMAMGLWVQAGSWSGLNETNGFIPEDITEEFAPVTVPSHVTGADAVDVREALCDVGFWSRTDDGYQFEGWSEYQPTKEGVDEKRAKDAERKRRSRAQKKNVTPTSAVTDSDASAVTSCPRPPSRPVPSRTDPERKNHAQPSGPSVSQFDEFWSVYPRKVGKQKARTKYAAAVRRTGSEQTVIDGARRLAADPNLPEHQFIPHPSTWLERDGWDDEPLPARDGQAGESPRSWLDIARGPEQPLDYVDGQVIEFGALG